MSLIYGLIYFLIGFIFTYFTVKHKVLRCDPTCMALATLAWPAFFAIMVVIIVTCHAKREPFPWMSDVVQEVKKKKKKIKIAVSEEDEPDDVFLNRCKRL